MDNERKTAGVSILELVQKKKTILGHYDLNCLFTYNCSKVEVTSDDNKLLSFNHLVK